MITLTEKAYEIIKLQLHNRGKGVGIRLGVKTTGCSGLAYTMEYVDKYEMEVGVINYAQKDFVVLIDSKSDIYMRELKIDWIRNGLNEGFDFRNPNEKARCGCGSSFTV
jgi:iron-sulfur cluster assembly protein